MPSCNSCCKNKSSVRKGRWSPEEDMKLKSHITRHGVIFWRMVPFLAGLSRCGKSCRRRWLNYLRPGVRTHTFSHSEIALILSMQSKLGNKWSEIAKQLPGRTDNHVKNFWNSYLKPRQQAALSGSGNQNSARLQQQQQHSAPVTVADSHGTNAAAEAHVMLFHDNTAAANKDEIPWLVNKCQQEQEQVQVQVDGLDEDIQWSEGWMTDSLLSCLWDSYINVPLLR